MTLIPRHPKTLLALLMMSISCLRAAYPADTVLRHGHIFTGNPQSPWAESLLVSHSKIAAIGSDREVSQQAGHDAKIVDLHGHTVIPGIVDSHAHVLYGGFALHGLNLSTPERSITPAKPDDLVRELKTYAQAHPNDVVLFARADFSTTPPTTPGRELLDRAVPDRPLVIHNTSEHALWVNSAALKMAGVTDYPLPDAQEERGVVRDASGHPSGVLLEAAMAVVARAALNKMPEEDVLRMLAAATQYLNTFGITSVVNATGSLREIELFAALRDRGKLTVRTRTAFGQVAVAHHMSAQFLADLEEARNRYHDDWVAANLVKFFLDGSTGLIPPLVYEPHEYAALVKELDHRGFQVMTHAIRDDSVHLALDTYEAVEQANGARDRRFRIEHLDMTDEGDIARFAKLHVIPDMQPTFCCGDAGLNYDPINPIPTDRWKSLEDTGAALAFSSDWPCTWPPDPFVGIQEAVTRRVWNSADTANIAGAPLDGAAQGGAVRADAIYVPTERITVAQAVTAYTAGSAYAAFMDSKVGTLEKGKLADLAVLSQDPFTVAPQDIDKTKVTMTMVGGKVVYSAASPE
jgi:predicted amidohydrolase YtcJ